MTEFIDTHAIKAIVSLQRPGKPDLLLRIVELFKSETPKAIVAMQTGLDESDLSSVRNAAHTLKSSSAYVGAKALSERCRDLEAAAREENFPACFALCDGIEDLFDDSCAELQNVISKAA
ncbi:MAG: Hpt domain-containing protein [Granulosicoccus sp.]